MSGCFLADWTWNFQSDPGIIREAEGGEGIGVCPAIDARGSRLVRRRLAGSSSIRRETVRLISIARRICPRNPRVSGDHRDSPKRSVKNVLLGFRGLPRPRIRRGGSGVRGNAPSGRERDVPGAPSRRCGRPAPHRRLRSTGPTHSSADNFRCRSSLGDDRVVPRHRHLPAGRTRQGGEQCER